MSIEGMTELAAWWWDEAARCQEVGARGLAGVCRDRAIYWTNCAAQARAGEP